MKHLKSFHLFESNSDLYYHASSLENTDSINANGLTAKLGKKQWPQNDYPLGTYMFDNRDDALKYAVLILEDGEVWEIDGSGLIIKNDPEPVEGSEFEDANSYYTTDNIPTSKIKMLDISDDEKDDVYRMYESEKFNPNTTDIQADYDMLNGKLFDGKLQKVPLRWMRTKYKLGVMAYNEKGEIEYVGISNLYDLTRQQYLNVLAHEMIHVYMEQQGILEKDPHGRKFMSILDDLNAKNPDFQIAKSENAADFKVSDTGPAKTYGVVIIDEDGQQSLVAVQPSVLTDENMLDEFIKGIKGQSQYGVFMKAKSLTVSIYKSNHPDIPKFKIKKSLSLRSMELYVLDKPMADEIKMDELVREEKIK